MATPVAPGIITMGLGGNHSNLIIGFPFNLGFEVIVGSPIVPPVTPGPTHRPGGTGGTSERPWPDQTETEEDKFRTVTIRIKFKGNVTEKMYIVREERAEILVKVIKMINKTRAQIRVAVKGLRNKWSKAVANVKNLRTKKD